MRRWLLILAATSLALLALVLALIPRPAPERAAAPGAAPRVAAVAPRPEAPVAPLNADREPSRVARTAVRAALARRLRGLSLPANVYALIAAGEVAGALAAIQGTAHAAAAGWDLLGLCREPGALAGPDPEARVQGALTEAPGAEPMLRRVLAAARDLEPRLGKGCAAASLDAGSIHGRLKAAADAGDALALERLAAADPTEAPRQLSAALLGSPGAAFRLALDLLAPGADDGRREERHQAGLSWLKAAAREDPDAAAWYGSCELEGCAGPADATLGRATLESAARHGSLLALGALAAPGSRLPWLSPGDPVAPLPSPEAARNDDPAARYAWATLAAKLAAAGCFGFAWTATAEALVGPGQYARALSPAALILAEAEAARLVDESAGAAAAALGCEGG